MKIDWEYTSTIIADRVSLRAITNNDGCSAYEIFSDPEVMRFWGGSPMTKLREGEEFVAEVREDLRQHKCIQWGITQIPADSLIGTVALFAVDSVACKCEIAFALARAYWGKGLMRETLNAALSYAFDEIEFRRIEADVDPRNIPSIRLLESLGFKKEGYLRERWLTSEET